MPRYAVRRLTTLVNKNGEKLRNLRVAILGLTYKPGIRDTRRSPAIEVAYLLQRHAGAITAYDPYVTDASTVHPLHLSRSLESALKSSDAIFIATAHPEFKKLLPPALLKRHHIRYILDGRNLLDKTAFTKAGIAYRGIGQ